MNRLLFLAAGATLLAACSDSPTEPLVSPRAPGINAAPPADPQVTTPADDGPGSLRAAIEAANADASITQIVVKNNLGTVMLAEPIHYTGSQQLTLEGGGLTLNGSGLAGSNDPIFLADGGGNLNISNLTIQNAPGYGLQVEVPETATGIKSLTLDRVTVLGSGLHGVLMNDQETPLLSPFPDDGDVEFPADAQHGSGASLLVSITASTFKNNGFNGLDNDGVRINEGGDGNLDFSISGSSATENGADGIELDERGAGSAVFNVKKTVIDKNGFFDLATPFEDRDLDDGMDVDEWGEGNLVGWFEDVDANRNAEQGLDLNENEAGDLQVTMRKVEGSRNGQEGIELEEDDDVAGGGSINADFEDIITNSNGVPGLEDDEGTSGDGGLKSREKGVGDNTTRVVGVVSNNNQSADGDGVIIREEGDGNIETELTDIVATNNPVNGVQVREANAGALDAEILGGTVANNGNVGVRLRDNGTAVITNLTNPNGIQAAGGVTVTINP